jgi:hypothetical protein
MRDLQLNVELPTVTNLASLCNQQGAEIGNLLWINN